MIRSYAAFLLFVVAGTVPAFAVECHAACAEEPLIADVTPAPPAAPSRGHLLPILYLTYGSLQVYDGITTITGARHGATETNPLLSGIAGNAAAVWTIKAASVAGTLSISEYLWRHHRRREALVAMVIGNGVLAAVAGRNAAVMRTIK